MKHSEGYGLEPWPSGPFSPARSFTTSSYLSLNRAAALLPPQVEDTDRMLAACEANGTVLSVDHTRRFTPLWRYAVRAARGG